MIGQSNNGGLDLFFLARGTDAIAHRLKDPTTGSWAAVKTLPGTATAFAIARNGNRLEELFYRGTDGGLHHNRQTVLDGAFGAEQTF